MTYMNSFEYRRLGVARVTAMIQQVKMVRTALFRVDLGKKGFTIARYLRQVKQRKSIGLSKYVLCIACGVTAVTLNNDVIYRNRKQISDTHPQRWAPYYPL